MKISMHIDYIRNSGIDFNILIMLTISSLFCIGIQIENKENLFFNLCYDRLTKEEKTN